MERYLIFMNWKTQHCKGVNFPKIYQYIHLKSQRIFVVVVIKFDKLLWNSSGDYGYSYLIPNVRKKACLSLLSMMFAMGFS